MNSNLSKQTTQVPPERGRTAVIPPRPSEQRDHSMSTPPPPKRGNSK